MRKIYVFNRISLDGFFAGPKGEIDWFIDDRKLDQATHEIMHPDTLLLGRRTYKMFEAYWPNVGADPKSPKHLKKIADELNQMNKMVFTKTLKRSKWENTNFVRGNVVKHVKDLKAGRGSDIVIFGSGTIIRQLADAQLIDEYLLGVTPVVLGKGKPMFKHVKNFNLKLVESHPFKTGNTLLHYRLAK